MLKNLHRHFIWPVLFFIHFNSHAQIVTTIDTTLVRITELVDSSECLGPWDLAWGPDNQLWYTDGPYIKKVNPTTGQISTMWEQAGNYGLGITFFNDSLTGNMYVLSVFDTGVYYASGGLAHLMRMNYSMTGDSVYNDTILLSYPHGGEHCGGRIAVGIESTLAGTYPSVYLSTADYFSCTYDTLGSTKGKILRIGIDGSVPPFNPRADYTFSYGHRNPQGLAFTETGALISSEHGQFTPNNELNQITYNKFYGYPLLDGMDFFVYTDSLCLAWMIPYHESPLMVQPYPPAGIDYYNSNYIPEWEDCILEGLLGPSVASGYGINAYRFGYSGIYAHVEEKNNYLAGLNLGRTRDICAGPDGKIYMITNDRLNGDLSTVYDSDARIRVIEKINPTGISEYTGGKNAFVFPNPATDMVQVYLSETNGQPVQVTIVDAYGRTVKSRSETGTSLKLNVADLHAGIYFVITNQANGPSTVNRLIIQ